MSNNLKPNESNPPCKWVCERRKEDYSVYNLVIKLIMIIPAFFIGIYGLLNIPVIGIVMGLIYGIWCFTSYFVIFRIVLCPNCYYYGKWCPDGMGKFAKAAFKRKGNIESCKKSLLIPTIGWSAIVIIPPLMLTVYFFLVPVAAIFIHLGFIFFYIPVLFYAIFFLLYFLFYFSLHRRLSCKDCAHGDYCNLNILPFPALFLMAIIALSLLQLIYLNFFCQTCH